jgi:hypothetical protein
MPKRTDIKSILIIGAPWISILCFCTFSPFMVHAKEEICKAKEVGSQCSYSWGNNQTLIIKATGKSRGAFDVPDESGDDLPFTFSGREYSLFMRTAEGENLLKIETYDDGITNIYDKIPNRFFSEDITVDPTRHRIEIGGMFGCCTVQNNFYQYHSGIMKLMQVDQLEKHEGAEPKTVYKRKAHAKKN